MKIYFSLLLSLVWCIFPCHLKSQEKEDRTKSIFWEIKKTPTSSPSYIYGTMHVSRKVAFKVPRQFFDAVESVDMVALESSPESWQREIDGDTLLSHIAETFNRSNNDYLLSKKDIFTRMLGIFPIYKGYLKWLISRKSVLANQLLFRSDQMNQDFSEDTYLDFFIFQMGKKLNKPILSLEDVRVATLHAYKASLYEAAKVRNNREIVPRMGELVEVAYAQRDIYTLDSLYKKSFSEMYLEHLLYLRNQDMYATFDSVANLGKSVFMAVGAAHLPGEKGMLQLLRDNGYTVRAIVDSSYFDPSQKILGYDTVFVSSTPELQYTQDSCITFMAPGYLSRKVDIGMVEYLCPDMPNGCYYSLNRVPLFTGLYKNDHLLDRLDSLIYESTSGDITEKSKIKFAGYDAILVKSTTAESKNLQSLYVHTPYEFLVFKIIGHQKYLNDKIAKSFFESVKINYPNGMQRFDEKGIKAKMPISPYEPIYQPMDFDKPSFFKVSYDNNGRLYLIARARMEDGANFEEDEFQLRFMAEMAAKEIGAKMTDWKIIKDSKVPTARATLRKTRNNYFVQTSIRGDNYFYALTTAKNLAEANHFFNSMDISPAVKKKNLYQNDTMNYEILATVPEYGMSLNDMIFKSKVTQSSLASDNTKILHSNFFRDMDLGYDVDIQVKELHPYTYFMTVDSFWSDYKIRLDEELRTDNPYVINEESKEDANDVSKRIFALSDTASSRIVYYTAVLSGNRLYEAKSISDSKTRMGVDVKQTMKSFQVNRKEEDFIRQPKLKKFIADFNSKDSLTKEIFDYNYNRFELDSSEIPSLISFLDTSKTITKKEKIYYFLIEKLSDYKSPAAIAYLEKLYEQNANNFDVQFETLYALAAMNEPKAMTTFKKLIIKEPPLSSDSYSDAKAVGPSQVFMQVRDTANNAQALFPEILELMDYREYNTSITNMIRSLIEKNRIDTNAYLERKKYFRNQLWQEYRRKTATKTFLQKLAEDAEDENSAVAYSYYYEEPSFVISQSSFSSQNFSDQIKPYKFYDFKKYKQICATFTKDRSVQELLGEIACDKNTDLAFMDALEFIDEDSTEVSTAHKQALKMYFDEPALTAQVTQLIMDSKHRELLDEFIPDAKFFSDFTFKERIDYTSKDSFMFLKKRRIDVLGELKDLYIYKYKKEEKSEWNYGLMGLFGTKEKYIDDYIYLTNIPTTGKNSNIDKLVDDLQYQFESLERENISPGDFSLEKDPMKEDPFYFMLLR